MAIVGGDVSGVSGRHLARIGPILQIRGDRGTRHRRQRARLTSIEQFGLCMGPFDADIVVELFRGGRVRWRCQGGFGQVAATATTRDIRRMTGERVGAWVNSAFLGLVVVVVTAEVGNLVTR